MTCGCARLRLSIALHVPSVLPSSTTIISCDVAPSVRTSVGTNCGSVSASLCAGRTIERAGRSGIGVSCVDTASAKDYYVEAPTKPRRAHVANRQPQLGRGHREVVEIGVGIVAVPEQPVLRRRLILGDGAREDHGTIPHRLHLIA